MGLLKRHSPHAEEPELPLMLHPSLAHKQPLTLARPMQLTDMPAELLTHVGRSLHTAKDLCSFQQAHSLLRDATKDDLLWRRLCQKEFGTPTEFVTAYKLSWREAYRLQRRVLYEVLMTNSASMAPLNMGSMPLILRGLLA